MADGLYTKFKQNQLLNTDLVDFDADTVKGALFRASTYTVNLATDEFLSTAGTPISTATLTINNTIAANTIDAADFTFTAVGAGAAIDILVIYKDTGVAGTSPLIAKYDISVTPNGGDINVTVNASGLFSL